MMVNEKAYVDSKTIRLSMKTQTTLRYQLKPRCGIIVGLNA
jgi:hypothetical protein